MKAKKWTLIIIALFILVFLMSVFITMGAEKSAEPVDMGYELSNKGYFNIPLWGDNYIVFNDTMFATIVIAVFLFAFALFVRIKFNKFDPDKPATKFQGFIEMLVETMRNFTISNMGEKQAYFGAWFFGLFSFILVSNLSGLIGLRPPTVDIAVTLGFSITTVCIIHFIGLVKNTKKYLKGYFEPMLIMFPMNVVGEIAPIISLSFRMFGNLFAGFVIMSLFYQFMPIFVQFGIPSVLHSYFDVFSAAMQAFVFTILSMVFIKSKAPE
jgi:F-type H+-transporting ATPase subunit a